MSPCLALARLVDHEKEDPGRKILKRTEEAEEERLAEEERIAEEERQAEEEAEQQAEEEAEAERLAEEERIAEEERQAEEEAEQQAEEEAEAERLAEEGRIAEEERQAEEEAEQQAEQQAEEEAEAERLAEEERIAEEERQAEEEAEQQAEEAEQQRLEEEERLAEEERQAQEEAEQQAEEEDEQQRLEEEERLAEEERQAQEEAEQQAEEEQREAEERARQAEQTEKLLAIDDLSYDLNDDNIREQLKYELVRRYWTDQPDNYEVEYADGEKFDFAIHGEVSPERMETLYTVLDGLPEGAAPFLESIGSITICKEIPFTSAPAVAVGSHIAIRADQLDSLLDTRGAIAHEMAHTLDYKNNWNYSDDGLFGTGRQPSEIDRLNGIHPDFPSEYACHPQHDLQRRRQEDYAECVRDVLGNPKQVFSEFLAAKSDSMAEFGNQWEKNLELLDRKRLAVFRNLGMEN